MTGQCIFCKSANNNRDMVYSDSVNENVHTNCVRIGLTSVDPQIQEAAEKIAEELGIA